MNTAFYDSLKEASHRQFEAHHFLQKEVIVKARALSSQEAIGHPDSDDYPIQKGKERLMQAEIEGVAGQAFTDRFGDYNGTFEQVLAMPLTNNYRRAVFVAALNAGLRRLGMIDGTVHCRDHGPKQCAEALQEHIQKQYGRVKIAQIGFQPRMLEELSSSFEMKVLDLDPDNIGTVKHGISIGGPLETAAAIEWADLLLVTGTTLVNGSLPDFLGKKPVLFYGTTIAGAAYLMGWERFCACST
jgi:hypothetical protein